MMTPNKVWEDAIVTSTPTARTALQEEPSIGQLASTASESLSTIIRGEIALAKTELSFAVKRAGIGAVMFVVAGAILLFSLTFGLIALAEGLVAAGLWRWLSYLIVFAFLVLLAVVLVVLGIRNVKKVKGPKRTMETAKDTAAYLRHPAKTTS